MFSSLLSPFFTTLYILFVHTGHCTGVHFHLQYICIVTGYDQEKRKKNVAITENSYCNWSFCCWLGKMLYFLPFLSITHSFLTMWTWCRGSLVPTTLRQMEEDKEFIMAANQLKQFGQVFELSEKTILKTIFIMHGSNQLKQFDQVYALSEKMLWKLYLSCMDPTSSSSSVRYALSEQNI